MRKALLTAAAAALALLPALPAQAAPLDPCQRDPADCQRYDPSNLGPAPRDFYCVWSWRQGREVCSYHPGNGASSGKLLLEFRWDWTPWN